MTVDLQTGSVVTVQVQRVTPFGLRVELQDGQVGVVREREISWSTKLLPEQLVAQYHPGESLPAVVLGRTSDGRLELSLRLVQSDPWDGLTTRYKVGDLVEGVITGIQTYGIFVELEPGVTGLLHASHLADWVTGPIPDLFWPGDEIYVTIESIDTTHRRLGLSHARAWSQRWPDNALTTSRSIRPSPSNSASTIDHLPLGLWVTQAQPRTVLVVDDYAAHLEALTTWLQRAGQRAIRASSAEEALALMAVEQPDLVLMDLGLPGMSGLEGVGQIRQRYPDVQCVIMTDWSRADEHTAELDALRAVGVKLLVKPLLPEDLLDALKPLDAVALASQPDGPGVTPLLAEQTPVQSTPSRQDPQELLTRLRQMTGAVKVVLFQLDPAHRQISIALDSGPEKLRDAALVNTIHSPIRDVAEDEVLVRVDNIALVADYVRNLTPLLNFQACLGLPVSGHLSMKHALFVFFARTATLSPVHEAQTQATALALSNWLEQQEFQTHSIELQRLALLGNLTRALVHEINHQLSPVSFVIGDLEEQCHRLEHRPYDSVLEIKSDLTASRDSLRNLSSAVRNLINTARMFHQMTVKGSEQIVNLDEAAGEVARLLRDQADRGHVRLEVVPIEQVLFTRTHAAQIQQVLLNVTLNAIQHIALTRPKRGGQVRIRVGQKVQEATTLLQVYVEDDGPGIHRRLWERIFDLGFTTRQSEGSGLGLYISRSLVEAIGGRIYVAESAMLWGTTLVIELPSRL